VYKGLLDMTLLKGTTSKEDKKSFAASSLLRDCILTGCKIPEKYRTIKMRSTASSQSYFKKNMMPKKILFLVTAG
jgi:hypothetical protein